MKIRMGIIGHGFMGHTHVDMLTKMEGYQVVAVADIDRTQLKDVPPGIKAYETAEELTGDPDVDVVLIAANNNQHHKLVHMAARAGKDVICEKPAALNSGELAEMEKICRECNVRFTVHQQRRFDVDFRRIKAVYDSGTLGKVYSIKSSLYGYNGNMHDWHVYKSEGGGMMYDWGVHLLDQLLWMIDSKVKSVYADVRSVINKEVDDYFKVILYFENDIVAEVELGTYFLADKEDWFTHHWFISGNKASAYTDGFEAKGHICRTTRLLENVADQRTMTAAGPTRSFGTPEEGLLVTEDLPVANTTHQNYFENYYRAWNGEEPFLVQIPEVKRVMRLMEAAWESAKTHQTVAFE